MTDPRTQEQELQKLLAARLAELPGAVQRAITSADVPAHLQELSKTHKLHMDQWQTLENEVMLTILGFQQAEDLAKNIQNQVGVSEEIALSLTEDIGKIVFNPIREELERELGHPHAKDEEVSDIEKVRGEVLADERHPQNVELGTQNLESSQYQAPSLQPPISSLQRPVGTPPPDQPTEKVARSPASGAYKPGETSAARADVHDDPYRESPA